MIRPWFTSIASLGLADEQQPLYWHLILTQDDEPSEDGFVYAYDGFNLSLNADLVMLRACETGLGQYVRGDELTGLTHAFLYARAPTWWISWWSVDESASIIMKDFYQHLKNGWSKTAALREAKLKSIRTRDIRFSLAHPFLWALLVLVGNGHRV